MDYLLLICTDGVDSEENIAVFQAQTPGWVQEMDGRGIRKLGDPLEDPRMAATVRVRDGQTLVSDGPFAESKEFVAGFDVLSCADLDEAIEVASKHPMSWMHTVEIRPFWEGLQLGAEAEAFSRGELGGRTPYCLMMCLDGIPVSDAEEAAILRDGLAWAEDLRASDRYIFGHPLQHKDMATTVRVRGGETLITDGPFIDTHEFIGGIVAIYCEDQQEAIAAAATHPLARYHMVEVRKFWTM